MLGIGKMRKYGMRKEKCGMQSAECTWLAIKQNHVTLPIPQFTTSRLAMHGNKMLKVIRGKVTLCVITPKDCYAMTRSDSNIV